MAVVRLKSHGSCSPFLLSLLEVRERVCHHVVHTQSGRHVWECDSAKIITLQLEPYVLVLFRTVHCSGIFYHHPIM